MDLTNYSYNKDEIKNSLTVEQVLELVSELDGEPIQHGDMLVCKTICHGGEKHRLYYYNNTKLFKCFTDCADTFDIFELVRKVKSRENPRFRVDEEGTEFFDSWNLPEAIAYVADYFGFQEKEKTFESFSEDTLEEWRILNRYEKLAKLEVVKKEVDLKVYEDTLIKNLPAPIILPWLKEGITRDAMAAANIRYNPKTCGIVIPHYNEDNALVGIRERTLIKEEEWKGKYRPSYINGQLYNHPLSFALYNLNNSRDNISKIKKAVVFEGEKSTLLYSSYFGAESDISVANCGSALISYQVQLLIESGAEEIIIAHDKQFKEIGDEEFKKLTKNFRNMHKKYSHLVRLSFLFDKWGYLNYKDSPIDQGKEVFMELYKRRIYLD